MNPYVRRASCAASPRRRAPSKHRRIVVSSHYRGGRVAVTREALATTTHARSTARAAAHTRGSIAIGVVRSTRVLAHPHSNDAVHRAFAIRWSSRVAGTFASELRRAMMVGGCGGGGWR